MGKEVVKIKIYKIVASYIAASKIDPFALTLLEYHDVKDTGKSYMFDGKRLSRDKLNKIEINIVNPRVIKCFTFVPEENVNEYKQLVYNTVINKLNEFNHELQVTIDVVSKWSGEAKTRVID